MAEEKTDEQLEQEAQDALDFGGGGVEDNRPWDQEEEEVVEDNADDGEEQEADDEEVAEEEDAEQDVATESDEDDGSDEEGSSTFTLDGKKYTAEEIAADPKLLSKMATHYNQVGNFQKIADERNDLIKEREERIAQLEAENRKVMDEWTRNRMLNEQKQREEAEKEAAAAAQPPPRPPADQLKAHFKPHIDQLVEQGRLSVDELDEHSGLVAEYLYDTATTRDLITKVVSHFAQEINSIRGFIDPAVKSWDEEKAVRADAEIQKAAAELEGYDELSDPEIWQQLKQFVADKVMASPKDADGNPTFNPIFDGPTMASMYDAMTGSTLRKALGGKKKKAKQQIESDRRKAGGSATGGGKKPTKRPKPKQPKTEAEDALDWGDSGYATG